MRYGDLTKSLSMQVPFRVYLPEPGLYIQSVDGSQHRDEMRLDITIII